MMLKLVLLSLLSLTVEGASFREGKKYYDPEQAETYFLDFMKTYNKSYETKSEYNKRFEIFAKRLEKINELNKKHALASFAVNFLSDLTAGERSAQKGFRAPTSTEYDVVPAGRFDGMELPNHVDWRENNSVTPVKYQGYKCSGSYWAFSAVGVIESQVAIKHKKQVYLSEQQMLDCDMSNLGCDGGDPLLGFKYAAKGGMMQESDYPFRDESRHCHFKKKKVAVKVKGGQSLGNTTEDEMAKYVANYGPISAAIYMSDSLKDYTVGLADPGDCGTAEPNSYVVIIGYGKDGNTPYWIIKNSMGDWWGDDGYFKLIRGKEACQITSNVAIVDIE